MQLAFYAGKYLAAPGVRLLNPPVRRRIGGMIADPAQGDLIQPSLRQPRFHVQTAGHARLRVILKAGAQGLAGFLGPLTQLSD